MKGPVLPLAVLLSSPALYSAFVAGSMPTLTALIRFLLAVVVASTMLRVLNSVTAEYQKSARRKLFYRRLPPELQARVKPNWMD